MEQCYDAVVVGAGPAGLASAIYLARAQYRVLIIEKEKIGGQITITSEVVNYPGILSTDGEKLTETMRRQAENFGAEFLMAKVLEMDCKEERKKIKTEKGTIEALGIVLATGASPKKAGFIGEEKFRGRGVAYCATCDGEFFSGKDIFVIGGGFAAAEEALFLTRYAKKVTILVRGETFRCAQSVVREVMEHPDIEVKFHTQMKEAGGEEFLQYAILYDSQKKESFRYEAPKGDTFGVFVFAGYEPASELFRDFVNVNEAGYLITDQNQQTNVSGIYGAGDVCVKELRQVVTAVSDGAVAATSLEKYLFSMYQKLGMKREKLQKKQNKEQLYSNSNDFLKKEKGFLTEEMKQSLRPVFERFQKDVTVNVMLDDSKLANEIRGFANEMNDLCPKIHFKIKENQIGRYRLPALVICDGEGKDMGIVFHGVPGGHEFNSFIIALYNVAGPGQKLEEEIKAQIHNWKKPIHMSILVSLSCTMCPELVMAAQKIAAENEYITAEMYDIAHYPDLKEQYKIMSVPCLVIKKEKRQEQIHFGKKGIRDLWEILKQ